MSNLLTKQFFVPKILMAFACVFIFFFSWTTFFPLTFDTERKAKIVFTRFETKEIASILKQCSIEAGGFTNIDNSLVFQAVFGTKGDINLNYYLQQTNSQGQVLDCWRTAYQIQILERTNFVVSSAGPNKKFSDADDIIFNTISNDFVKP